MTGATATAFEFFTFDSFLSEGSTARTDLGFWSRLFGQAHAHQPLDSSTALQPDDDVVRQEFVALFNVAKEEVLEDGIESGFSNGLIDLVMKYDQAAIDGITTLILDRSCNEELASEALRWLSRMEHSLTYDRRLWLFERCLASRSARIRDAASVALASLDDAHAITYLEEAISREQYDELRDDMTQILVQLKNTFQCR